MTHEEIVMSDKSSLVLPALVHLVQFMSDIEFEMEKKFYNSNLYILYYLKLIAHFIVQLHEFFRIKYLTSIVPSSVVPFSPWLSGLFLHSSPPTFSIIG